jgi:hypothetical protein
MGGIGFDIVHEIGTAEVGGHVVARPPGQLGGKGDSKMKYAKQKSGSGEATAKVFGKWNGVNYKGSDDLYLGRPQRK